MGAYVYIRKMCVFPVYICIQIFKLNPHWKIFDRICDTDAQRYLVQVCLRGNSEVSIPICRVWLLGVRESFFASAPRWSGLGAG